MKSEKLDLSAAAITARLLAICSKPKPKSKPAKVTLPLEVSAEAAERAKANPRDIKFVTKEGGVTHLERPVVVEATTRELEQQGLAVAPRAYYERLDEALRYLPHKGSVSHVYHPFAAEKE